MKTSKSESKMIRQGMTLIEVLLVVTILLVIASAVVPRLVNRQEKANVDTTKISLKGLEQALKLYAIDHDGRYPTSAQGIDSLMNCPDSNDESFWQGPYLEELPKDAWRRDFRYTHPASKSNKAFDLSSSGPDGVHGNDDDVTNWD
jgi:general secretion pathway protein G